jgi:putative addiction module CopG family antidote
MAGEPIQITLTDEDAIEFVRSKVASGQYASAADVVREGVLSLPEDEAEFERWLKEKVAERYDQAAADPASLIPIEQVEENLAKRRRRSALAS